MRAPVKFKWLLRMGALSVLMASFLSAQTSVVFVADEDGNVGRFVDGQTSGTALGSLSGSGFSVNQVLGIAYDSNTNAVLLFDRFANTVYTMNATTGVATVLFTTESGVRFQGGAVFQNLVYGIDENTQTIVAYSFSGVRQSLTNASLTEDVHALGVDFNDPQIISFSVASGSVTSNVLRRINTDGSEGSIVFSNPTSDIDAQDIAYFYGDYLVATFEKNLYFLDGSSGALSSTPYLNSTQLSAMGVTGYVTGVVLEYTAVPEPGTWALMLIGMGIITVVSLKRRRTS